MKQIKQFRYYGSTNSDFEKNYPVFSSGEDYKNKLTKGNIFENHGAITKLGIQSRPNIKFYLNDSAYPIIIGETGIYELDLEGYGFIHSIRFENLDSFDNPTGTDRLLIDIVYEGSGVVS